MTKSRHFLLLALCTALTVAAVPGSALAQADDVAEQARGLVVQQLGHPDGNRVELEIGRLDPRLRLAPCQKLEPYLPTGARLWGRTHVGLRCIQGPVPWNVYLPVTVKVFGRALVAATSLGVGQQLAPADLREAEVDLAEDASPAVLRIDDAVGRVLLRPLAPGQTLRQAQMKARQWFAAGDTVKLVAQGAGYSVSGEGQAITPGMEGQESRVRIGNGHIVTGMPVGERVVEISP